MPKTLMRTLIKADAAIAIERGKRLKMCRGIADRTLEQLALAYNISISCLAKWERGQLRISERNAPKILNMLASEGVMCSQEWLLHGIGNPPAVSTGSIFFQKDNAELISSSPDISPELAMFNEIEFFKRNNRNAIVRTVPDESMAPVFSMGDFVGGIEIPADKYRLANGDYCIIELMNNQIFIRRFFIRKGKITLVANAEAVEMYTSSLDSGIKRVCPIIYHRKLFKYRSDSSADDKSAMAQ